MSIPTKSQQVWATRTCEHCGAQPGHSCTTPTGKRAGLPHRERWPEGPPRTYPKPKPTPTPTPEPVRSLRELRTAYSHLPLDLAIKQRLNDQAQAFRQRTQTTA